MNRRKSLATLGVLALSSTAKQSSAEESVTEVEIATNTYPWLTFARRKKEAFEPHAESLLKAIAGTGITGYEPIVAKASEFAGLAGRLDTHGLKMHSLYVNSVLHDESKSEESMANVIAIAEGAKKLGTKIVVTNPSPIRWGGAEDKTDEQLKVQAKALDSLGAQLSKLGMVLAYHNHDAELRQGGREFHHMLTATNPEHVKLCLDAHWIFRGCGDSELAVFDALSHYHGRVVELHLRQSQKGVWTEAFAIEGDIDYGKILRFLHGKEIAPHLVLEQAVEAESPQKLGCEKAHRLGRERLMQWAKNR